MNDELSSKRCLACEGGVAPLQPSEIKQLLQQIPNWNLSEKEDSVWRRFEFKGFQKTVFFINALAWIVNQENHHPTLEVGYDYCIVRFTTHFVKGLTQNDFICAAKIDKLI
ncbi:MAG: 4a-hydroxytetrahydrobiopterin dehydratase [Proteobacteria bacterium]|nr:4a-hydroxytetrahydrobiopterin dehydratase [Pseudomonadota bacterium]